MAQHPVPVSNSKLNKELKQRVPAVKRLARLAVNPLSSITPGTLGFADCGRLNLCSTEKWLSLLHTQTSARPPRTFSAKATVSNAVTPGQNGPPVFVPVKC
ncbi:hypothetical protein AMECASPLE_023320 [Ameca splendens]|uniref:Uncharacterized protein n=1 Tax=Ameca splendens TaxID=208324 RepID=A0ABV0Y426_9TELE